MLQSLHIIIAILAVVTVILSAVLVSGYKKSQEQFALGGFQSSLWNMYLANRIAQTTESTTTV